MTEDVEPEALHAEEALGSARAPRALLAPANVDQNLRDAAQVWAVMVGCWLGILFGTAALYPLWVLILGGRLNALGVILHELCHMPPQRGGRALLLEVLAGWPIRVCSRPGWRNCATKRRAATSRPTESPAGAGGSSARARSSG